MDADRGHHDDLPRLPDDQTEVIVASVRHPEHVREAAKLGAHIATVPPKLLDQLIGHPMTDKGLAAFLADWEKAKKTVAPAGAPPIDLSGAPVIARRSG